MSWIRGYSEEDADPRTRRLFERVAGPGGQIDNILRLHGLRAHTLEGHMALYKSVLHHTSNRLPAEFLEALGVLTSALNRCDYCADHHTAGMRRAMADEVEADRVVAWIGAFAEWHRAGAGDWNERDTRPAASDPEKVPPAPPVSLRLEAACHYAVKLTLRPWDTDERDIAILRECGLEDGEILEINQVVAYFAYANRTVMGLGATTEGEELGYHPSPSPDLESWDHS